MDNTKVRKCTIKLEDTDLLAKLAPGNMHAGGKVSFKCLVNLYNKLDL